MIDLATAEHLAFTKTVAIPTERDVLRVTGPDAVSYLQGQLSQNVERLTIGSSAWTLLLQPQGKVDSWLRLHRRGDDELWLDVGSGHGAAARDRLERFKLRVDVEFELLSVPMLAVRGPAQAKRQPVDGVAGLHAEWGGLDGMDYVGSSLSDRVAPPALASMLGLDPSTFGPPDVLDIIRVRTGFPSMGSELDESTIAAAANIVEASVDFDKGCYVGQELVARVDSRGNNTPTRLHGFRVAGGRAADIGRELVTNTGAAAGTVTTVVESPELGTIGLAYIRRSVDDLDSMRVASASDESVPIAAFTLPFPVR